MMISETPLGRLAKPVRIALKGDLLRHGALVFGAITAANVLNYVFNFALSRRLGVDGFATLSSLVSIYMLLSVPTAILALVVVRYAAVFHAAQEHMRIRRFALVLLKVTGIAAGAIFFLGILAHSALEQFLHISANRAVILNGAIIGIGLPLQSIRAVLQGEQDFVGYSVSAVLEVLLKAAAAIVLVYAGYGVPGAMLGWLFGSAVALAYTIWAAVGKHDRTSHSAVRLNLDLKRFMRTTSGVAGATACLTTISFVDVLLVKHYFGSHDAGLYAAVNLTGKVVLFLAAFVPAVLLPKASAKHARGENPIPLLIQAGLITAAMSGLALALFGLEPQMALRLLAGRQFVAAAPYVFQYDGAMALLAIATLLVNYKISIHRFGFLVLLTLVVTGEILAIALMHNNLLEVIRILLVGNACAVVVCFPYRLHRVAVPVDALAS